jgi:hypothetical protein
MKTTQTISVVRPFAQIRPGDLISTGYGLAFVAWTTTADGEFSYSNDIGYQYPAGEYHERTARAEYEVWLEHPVIGQNRDLEASLIAAAEEA